MKAKKARQPEATRVFGDLVAAMSYKGKPNNRRLPLGNITFWAGAGFSKSWDLQNPTGGELFTIPKKEFDGVIDSGSFWRLFGGSEDDKTVSFDAFQQIVYMLDMHERHADIRSRYFDIYNLGELRRKLRGMVTNR